MNITYEKLISHIITKFLSPHQDYKSVQSLHEQII